MASNAYNWPPSHYTVGSEKHIHALGAVAALYNDVEFSLFCLFLVYSKLSNTLAKPLFENMSNAQRLDFLTRCIEENEQNDILKDHALYFINCFSICAENRNFLMHSTLQRSANPENIILTKASRDNPNKVNTLNANITTLRSVANEIMKIDDYAVSIYIYVYMNAQWIKKRITNIKFNDIPFSPTLPKKPVLPNKLLKPVPTTPKPPKRQRVSSRQRCEQKIAWRKT
jgi:hypothetical protein